MTRILFLLSFVSILNCKAQTEIPFYEQIAFDFYNSEIIPKSNFNVKLKIPQHFSSTNYVNAECLKNKIVNEKNISTLKKSKASQGYTLTFKNLNKKKFKKVKKINTDTNKENYILVSQAIEFNNRIFVIIRDQVNINQREFTFEFDSTGNIIDWCQSSTSVFLILK